MRLFTTLVTENLEMKNRIFRSATAEVMADEDGRVTESLIELYRNLAKGGASTIITGFMYVSEDGKAIEKMVGISKDEHIEGLSKLVSEVKKVDESVVFVAQLCHAGRQTRVSEPVAPSRVEDPSTGIVPRELRKEEIERIVDDFAKSAERAERAGFDAVQLHSAHGYLLSQFISPHTNRREDEYGKRRGKIILDILERIKERCEIPVMIKMNACDFIPRGLEVKDAVEIAKTLEKAGLELIEVSGGMHESAFHYKENMISRRIQKEEAYFAEFAKKIKREVEIPVGCVGGIRSVEVAEKLLEHLDFISLSRPLIRDPLLPAKWMRGESSESDCISCNRCLERIRRGEPLRCEMIR
jgi:2,4-dienoyl-CoA reductase-like NADH-dependent reductase (Old Yellow Enzyme family)